ncbi:hypothetical protein M8C21_018661 [Ambrosia artemisiifolia]|uniref:DUF7953 domain-containing protein n=1 Tax=Ambrosia artemisiifolia TaxID=4212 RepID=A0AAD5C1I2_AMBAR|nr:hypothetical protein M8C21_018661 [Ambrosia artemisiifolia]
MTIPWLSFLLLFSFPELLLSAVVMLHSLEIYTTHEWFASTPTVYFQCSGENKTFLPDVKRKNTVYTFRGEESFQPLTNFESTKCKRCGFYEEDRFTSDDVFDEWEFCPSDFKSDDGRYIRAKGNEFNATFLCTECVKKGTLESSDNASHAHDKGNGMHWSMKLIIAISVVASTILLIIGFIVAYKYWLKRKRQHEQARFLKLFEDTDDIEDELGIGPLSDSI